MTIGERVRTARYQRGLTQPELAARLGVSRHRVKDIEAWPGGFYSQTLVRLCRALEVSADWLLGLED